MSQRSCIGELEGLRKRVAELEALEVEHKLTGKALRESEERYRRLAENARDMIYRMSLPDGRYEYVNRSVTDLLGYSPEEFCSNPLFVKNLIHPDWQGYFSEKWENLISGDMESSYEYPVIHKSGRVMWMHQRNVLVRDEDGHPVAIEAIVTDITDRKKAEHALNEAAEILKATLESTADGILVVNKEGKILNASARFHEMWRIPGELIEDRDDEKLLNFVLDQIEEPEAFLARIRTLYKSSNEDFDTIYFKDGRIFERFSCPLVRDGEISGRVWSFREVTERARTEQALRESEERFRLVAESAPFGLSILRPDGTFEYLNPRFTEIFGYTIRDIPDKKSWLRKAYPDVTYRKKVVSIWKADTTSGPEAKDTGDRVFTVRCRAGQDKIVRFRNVTMKDKRHCFICEDISAHVKAQRALRESEEKFRELADLLPQPVFEIDQGLTFTFVNHAFRDSFGYKQDDFPWGLKVFHILAPEDHERAQHGFKRVLAGENPAGAEYTARRRDSTRFPAALYCNTIMRSNRLAGLRGIIVDITERKKAEEELLRAQKLESLGVLAGGIAHDFNNLLAAILGNVSVAQTCVEPGEAISEFLVAAERACLQAKGLTQQFITFSNGGLQVRQVQAIGELISDAAHLGLSGSNVEYELHASNNLWPVCCDAGQIRQLINNLIMNAKEAMPGGGTIEIEAKNERVETDGVSPLEPGNYIRITIKDHGLGIPEEYLARVSDPYFSTKQRGCQKGMGLGLTVAYSIARQHGGHLGINSREGQGTTCILHLPASEETLRESESSKPQTPAHNVLARALLMDDEEMLRNMAGQMLKRLGYAIELAKDGAEAIELFKKAKEAGEPLDVVILDLTIRGGMGGKEALDKILEIDPAAKAIVSSGYSSDPVMANCEKYGFKSAIQKPYRLNELRDIVHRVVSGH
jgi:PAS domain S-box-containing protein